MRNTIIGIIVVLLVVGGVFLLTRPDDNEPGANTPAQTQNDTSENRSGTESETNSDTGEVESVTIFYTNGGFSPSEYSIKAGGTVTVRNNSDDVLDFASDDHPMHTDNSELNAGEIPAGGSKNLTVTETGTWGFHNHLRDAHSGSITVE